MSNLFFFTDPRYIQPQGAITDAYGVYETGKFRVDNSFLVRQDAATDALRGDKIAEAPLIAPFDCFVLAIEDEQIKNNFTSSGDKLSYILKPIKPLGGFLSNLKYFIVKHVHRNSISEEGSGRQLKRTTPWLEKLHDNAEQAKAAANPAYTPSNEPLPESYLVVNEELMDILEPALPVEPRTRSQRRGEIGLDELFFHTIKSGKPVPTAKAGDYIGDFFPYESGNEIFRIELVMSWQSKIYTITDLANDQSNKRIIERDASAQLNAFDKRAASERPDKTQEVLRYLDVAAFYGMQSRVSVKSIDATSGNLVQTVLDKDGDEIYAEVMPYFFNRKCVYLDIRDDYDFALNSYLHQDEEGNSEKDLQFGNKAAAWHDETQIPAADLDVAFESGNKIYITRYTDPDTSERFGVDYYDSGFPIIVLRDFFGSQTPPPGDSYSSIFTFTDSAPSSDVKTIKFHVEVGHTYHKLLNHPLANTDEFYSQGRLNGYLAKGQLTIARSSGFTTPREVKPSEASTIFIPNRAMYGSVYEYQSFEYRNLGLNLYNDTSSGEFTPRNAYVQLRYFKEDVARDNFIDPDEARSILDNNIPVAAPDTTATLDLYPLQGHVLDKLFQPLAFAGYKPAAAATPDAQPLVVHVEPGDRFLKNSWAGFEESHHNLGVAFGGKTVSLFSIARKRVGSSVPASAFMPQINSGVYAKGEEFHTFMAKKSRYGYLRKGSTDQESGGTPIPFVYFEQNVARGRTYADLLEINSITLTPQEYDHMQAKAESSNFLPEYPVYVYLRTHQELVGEENPPSPASYTSADKFNETKYALRFKLSLFGYRYQDGHLKGVYENVKDSDDNFIYLYLPPGSQKRLVTSVAAAQALHNIIDAAEDQDFNRRLIPSLFTSEEAFEAVFKNRRVIGDRRHPSWINQGEAVFNLRCAIVSLLPLIPELGLTFEEVDTAIPFNDYYTPQLRHYVEIYQDYAFGAAGVDGQVGFGTLRALNRDLATRNIDPERCQPIGNRTQGLTTVVIPKGVIQNVHLATAGTTIDDEATAVMNSPWMQGHAIPVVTLGMVSPILDRLSNPDVGILERTHRSFVTSYEITIKFQPGTEFGTSLTTYLGPTLEELVGHIDDWTEESLPYTEEELRNAWPAIVNWIESALLHHVGTVMYDYRYRELSSPQFTEDGSNLRNTIIRCLPGNQLVTILSVVDQQVVGASTERWAFVKVEPKQYIFTDFSGSKYVGPDPDYPQEFMGYCRWEELWTLSPMPDHEHRLAIVADQMESESLTELINRLYKGYYDPTSREFLGTEEPHIGAEEHEPDKNFCGSLIMFANNPGGGQDYDLPVLDTQTLKWLEVEQSYEAPIYFDSTVRNNYVNLQPKVYSAEFTHDSGDDFDWPMTKNEDLTYDSYSSDVHTQLRSDTDNANAFTYIDALTRPHVILRKGAHIWYPSRTSMYLFRDLTNKEYHKVGNSGLRQARYDLIKEKLDIIWPTGVGFKIEIGGTIAVPFGVFLNVGLSAKGSYYIARTADNTIKVTTAFEAAISAELEVSKLAKRLRLGKMFGTGAQGRFSITSIIPGASVTLGVGHELSYEYMFDNDLSLQTALINTLYPYGTSNTSFPMVYDIAKGLFSIMPSYNITPSDYIIQQKIAGKIEFSIGIGEGESSTASANDNQASLPSVNGNKYSHANRGRRNSMFSLPDILNLLELKFRFTVFISGGVTLDLKDHDFDPDTGVWHAKTAEITWGFSIGALMSYAAKSDANIFINVFGLKSEDVNAAKGRINEVAEALVYDKASQERIGLDIKYILNDLGDTFGPEFGLDTSKYDKRERTLYYGGGDLDNLTGSAYKLSFISDKDLLNHTFDFSNMKTNVQKVELEMRSRAVPWLTPAANITNQVVNDLFEKNALLKAIGAGIAIKAERLATLKMELDLNSSDVATSQRNAMAVKTLLNAYSRKRLGYKKVEEHGTINFFKLMAPMADLFLVPMAAEDNRDTLGLFLQHFALKEAVNKPPLEITNVFTLDLMADPEELGKDKSGLRRILGVIANLFEIQAKFQVFVTEGWYSKEFADQHPGMGYKNIGSFELDRVPRGTRVRSVLNVFLEK